MHPSEISKLLAPFLAAPLSETQLAQVSAYLALLLKWNAKINLTALRSPEEIITRHFGESFFLACNIFPASNPQSRISNPSSQSPIPRVLDLGSGAGFPGLPLKIYAPAAHVTLIESNTKKAAFLREAIRTITLTDINVFAGRAEEYLGEEVPDERLLQAMDAPVLVTLRAVERFDRALPLAFRLLSSNSESTGPIDRERLPAENRMALLIGAAQVATAHKVLPHLSWAEPLPIPLSRNRVLLFGTVNQKR